MKSQKREQKIGGEEGAAASADCPSAWDIKNGDDTATAHCPNILKDDRCRLASVLVRQLSVALILCIAGPELAFLYQHWRCATDQRPPPYFFDGDTGELVLDENLSYRVLKSTIPGACARNLSLFVLFLQANNKISRLLFSFFLRVLVSLLLLTSIWVPLIVLATAGWMLSGIGPNSNDNGAGALRSIELLYLPGAFGRKTLSLQPRQLLETCAAVSGLLMTIAVSELLTEMGKGTFMRHRPNYYSLCGFNSETLQCEKARGKCAASQSFPSGHASLSMCGMMYLACYFCGKMLASKYRTTFKMVGCIMTSIPLLSWSVFVGLTRIVNHWHHPGDVAAGFALGAVSAVAVYHLYFPSFWNTQARGMPYSVSAMMSQQAKADSAGYRPLSQGSEV